MHVHLAARTERLKQAKDEADREVQAYKAQRESEFKRLQTDVRGLGDGGVGSSSRGVCGDGSAGPSRVVSWLMPCAPESLPVRMLARTSPSVLTPFTHPPSLMMLSGHDELGGAGEEDGRRGGRLCQVGAKGNLREEERRPGPPAQARHDRRLSQSAAVQPHASPPSSHSF